MREFSAQPRYWFLGDPFVRLWRRWMGAPDNQLPEAARLGSDQVEYRTHNPAMSNSSLFVVEGGHADDLWRRRMIALGLNPDNLALSDPALLLHLQKCRAQCESPQDCALDLARASTGQPWQGRDDWRDYCENVLTLEMLIALRSRSKCLSREQPI